MFLATDFTLKSKSSDLRGHKRVFAKRRKRHPLEHCIQYQWRTQRERRVRRMHPREFFFFIYTWLLRTIHKYDLSSSKRVAHYRLTNRCLVTAPYNNKRLVRIMNLFFIFFFLFVSSAVTLSKKAYPRKRVSGTGAVKTSVSRGFSRDRPRPDAARCRPPYEYYRPGVSPRVFTIGGGGGGNTLAQRCAPPSVDIFAAAAFITRFNLT